MSSQAPSRRKDKHVSRACNQCRRRKGRCDGVQPVCKSCSANGHECTWAEVEDGRRPPTRSQVDAMSMEIRTLRLENEKFREKFREMDMNPDAVLTTQSTPSSPSHVPSHSRPASLGSLHIHIPTLGGHQRSLSDSTPFANVTGGFGPQSSAGSRFLTVPDQHSYRGVSPDAVSMHSFSSTDDDEPRSATSDHRSAVSDTEDDPHGVLSPFMVRGRKLVVGEDESIVAVAGGSPLALSCSPPHTPSRSRASSRGSMSMPARSDMNAFRFPPTPNHSLPSPLDPTHDAACPCDWERFLPKGVMDRLEHDRILDQYFNFTAPWGVQSIRTQFFRDMRAVLSSAIPVPAAFYSPSLHCAVLADALRTDRMDLALVLMRNARELAEAECTRSDAGRGLIATITALIVISYRQLANCMRFLSAGTFGMAAHIASTAGYGLDPASLVDQGSLTPEERWERVWCWQQLLIHDVDLALHMGKELAIHRPPLRLALDPSDTTLGQLIFVNIQSLMLLGSQLCIAAPVSATDAAVVQGELAIWHDKLPDVLQLHRTSSSSAQPGIYILHMAHWWLTILLHRTFYATVDDSAKFVDDAGRKILRALAAYDRLYTYAKLPLCATQFAMIAGAASLLAADAAPHGAQKKRRDALESATSAVSALHAMAVVWPCAEEYAVSLERRIPLVSSGNFTNQTTTGSGSVSVLHSPHPSASANGSLPVPAVVVDSMPVHPLDMTMDDVITRFGPAMQVEYPQQWQVGADMYSGTPTGQYGDPGLGLDAFGVDIVAQGIFSSPTHGSPQDAMYPVYVQQQQQPSGSQDAMWASTSGQTWQ